MKVGNEPKVQQQQPVEEPKEAKGPEREESPKGADQADTFEDSKPTPDVDLGDMRAQQRACDEANAGKPAPQGRYDMEDPDVQRELTKTEEGKQLLADYHALKANGGLTVQHREFCDSGSAQWDETSRTISIDPDAYVSQEGYFQTVAHELTHASQTDGLNPGRDGRTATMDQFQDAESWADHEMGNEARAEARAYDLARSRGFERSSLMSTRTAYDAVLNAGGTREEAIQAVQEAMKTDPKWQAERATYVNDWNDWKARSAA
jgi:hypothetical protein